MAAKFAMQILLRCPQECRRVIFVVHQRDLVQQAEADFRECFSAHPIARHFRIRVEMGDSRSPEWLSRIEDKPGIVVASLMSLVGRLKHYRPNEFACFIFDECHHGPCESGRTCWGWFAQNPECRLLGLTATLIRKDQESLGKMFGQTLYSYGILDAINNGYLVPIEQQFVQVDSLDLSRCRADRDDLIESDLAEVMEAERNIYEISTSTQQIADGRHTMVFGASVKQAHLIAATINKKQPGSAVSLDGGMDPQERYDKLQAFRERDYQYLAVCGLCLEGFNAPSVELISMGRPTRSQGLYIQMGGRGTRVLRGVIDGISTPEGRRAAIAASAKPSCLLLDFVGNSGAHKLVCSANIFGDGEDEEVIELARERVLKAAGAVNMQDEIVKAKVEIAERKRVVAERQRLAVDAKYQTHSVDAFNWDENQPSHLESYGQDSDSDQEMRRFLLDLRFKKKEVMGLDSTQLREKVRRQKLRESKGLCSYRQHLQLKGYGIDTLRLRKSDASRLMKTLAQCNWRPDADARQRIINMASDMGVLLDQRELVSN